MTKAEKEEKVNFKINRCFPFTDEEIKRANYVFKKYGLSHNDYAKLIDEQGDVCAICGGVDEDKYLAVDHCHDSGKVRGLLCSRCNQGLGSFRDSVFNLKNAIKYLEK